MTIKLDPSESKTVVIQCTECPHWSAIRYGLDEAHKCAVNHELTAHPKSRKARKAAWYWQNKQAATRR